MVELVVDVKGFEVEKDFDEMEELLSFLEGKIKELAAMEETEKVEDLKWAYGNIYDFVKAYKEKKINFMDYYAMIYTNGKAVYFYLEGGEVFCSVDLSIIDKVLGGNEVKIDWEMWGDNRVHLYVKAW